MTRNLAHKLFLLVVFAALGVAMLRYPQFFVVP
jgi:hypothetical protein